MIINTLPNKQNLKKVICRSTFARHAPEYCQRFSTFVDNKQSDPIKMPKSSIFYPDRILLRVLTCMAFLPFFLPAISQNSKTDNIRLTLKMQQYTAILQLESSPMGEKIEALDSLASFCLYQGDTLQANWYNLEKASLLTQSGNNFETYAICKEIIQETTLHPHPSPSQDSLIRQALLQAAISASQSSFWEESLSLCSDFMQQYPNLSKIESAQIYSTIGIVNMNIGNMELAKQNHDRAINLEQENPSLFPINLKVKLYNGLAGWFFLNQQYDSSLYILQWLETFPPTEILPMQFCYLYNNISLIHSTIGNYKIALDYLQKALSISPELSESNYINAHLLRNLAWTYREKGDTEAAETYYQQALEYARRWNDKENLWLIQIEMGELYKRKGDTHNMYKYLLQGYQLKDEVKSIQNQQRSFLLNRDLELLKSKKEQEILQQNLELERLSNEKRLILIIVFASLLIIFLTASLWMIHQMLKSRKKDKELAQNLSLDYQASQEELQKKEKDLAAATLFAAQKDESLKNLKKQCTELLKQDMNAQQLAIVREMLQTINLCHYGSSWEEFRIRFDMAYPDFYKNLAETGVELTKSEKYLAALLAININTKEISSMTQKSPRSVETYIYRLRKKLGIPTETKTHDYFHAFLGKEAIRQTKHS